jgi:STE24 endopeptidase
MLPALVALFGVPPAIVAVLVAALSHAVAARLRGVGLTLRETVIQAICQQAGLVVPLIALGAAVSALTVAHDPRTAVTFLVVTIASRLALIRLQLASIGLHPHALTTGPLRDRIFALAGQAGVRIGQIYVLPMARTRMANAFALRGNVVLLTDYLLEHLSRREVDAVMAHEIVHLKHHHPFVLRLVVATGLAIPIALATVQRGPLPVMASILVLSLIVFTFVSRRCERIADRGAVRLCRDGDALVTGLARLTRLNTMPLDWSPWAGMLLTHPSTRQRAWAIGEEAGLPEARVEALLQGRHSGDDHYAAVVPADGESKIFSSVFKLSYGALLGWTMLGLSTLVPAGVLVALRWSEPANGRWVIDLGVVTLAAGLSLIAIQQLAVRPYPGLRKKLGARLSAGGLDEARENGLFVGLAPGTAPRVYEGFYDWDIAFLFVRGDRLVVLGEEARFTLRRDQVLGIEPAVAPPAWIPTPRVAVRWQDPSSGQCGAFTLRPADAAVMTGSGDEAERLIARLEAWWHDGAPTGGPVTEFSTALATVELPPSGSVTGLEPRALVRGRMLLPAVVLSSLASAAACALFGLPFSPWDGAGFVDVLAAAWFVQIWLRLPYWRWREPPASTSSNEARKAA